MSGYNYLIYLAGPISNLGFEESIKWRQYAMENIDFSIECLSPLRKKEYLKGKGNLTGSYEEWPLSTQRGIFARDRFDCHRSNLILVNLLNAKTVSIGTCMEIAWAAQANIPIVLIMEPGNIHEHPMINEACPFIVRNLDEAINLVHAILLPSNHNG